MKTELKCSGCNQDMPKENLDKENNPTWFGTYKGTELLQRICAECWKKGVRYEEIKD